ncbi:nucleoporin NDC1 [Chitinibacter sp. SCUT-21]|uniref:hypothetical protein n=1 Tax=Chitinibacter sp. SCUT-21 TaxID=2970891 RepID=UPI0035A71D53
MKSPWLALVQFFPLSIFALYAFWHGAPSDERWLAAFQIGALLALIQLIWVLRQAQPANRLILAANLYLIAGGMAAFFQQWWFLKLYGSLRVAAIFVFILAVGIVTTLCSPAGFIAQAAAPTQQVRTASYYLLAATLIALTVSLYYRGNQTWAAVVPIVSLVILQRILARRVIHAHNNESEGD